MRGRWLVVFILMYASLDICNPLMPGAVTFGAGESVEARTDRSRADDDAPSVSPAPAPEPVVPVAAPVARAHQAAPRPPADPGRGHVIRSRPSSPDSASPSEDH